MLLFYDKIQKYFYCVTDDGMIEKYGENVYSPYPTIFNGEYIYYDGKWISKRSVSAISNPLTGQKHTIYTRHKRIFEIYDLGIKRVIESARIDSIPSYNSCRVNLYPMYDYMVVMDTEATSYSRASREKFLGCLSISKFENIGRPNIRMGRMRNKVDKKYYMIGDTYISGDKYSISNDHKTISIGLNYYQISADKLIMFEDTSNDNISIYDEHLNKIKHYELKQNIFPGTEFMWVNDIHDEIYDENWEPLDIYDMEESLIIDFDNDIKLKIPSWLI